MDGRYYHSGNCVVIFCDCPTVFERVHVFVAVILVMNLTFLGPGRGLWYV